MRTNVEYKLTSKLNAKLKKVNKHLNKFGGRDLSTKEAIRFNIDNNAQSGYEAGSIAFDISDADYSNASANYHHWIGDALISISEEVTNVPYDTPQYLIDFILQAELFGIKKG
tara:strand:- start:1125 stop:1463 length:339 start_codon:yes stop_codon:yes gene_type:complete